MQHGTQILVGPDEPIFPFFLSPRIFISLERTRRLEHASAAGDGARKKIGPSSASVMSMVSSEGGDADGEWVRNHLEIPSLLRKVHML
jgi:hypothetical protein